MKRVLKLFLALMIPFLGWSQVPNVSGISPTSGKAGATLTITGANFNATDNTVYIGGALATVTSHGTGTITATIPAGASFGPVTVTNNVSGYTGSSQRTFTPTYNSEAGSSLQSKYFNSRRSYSTGTNSKPKQIVSVDLNGDGKKEVISCNQSSATITVFSNSSTSGTLSFTSSSYATAGGAIGITSGDFDGDGKVDIAVANNTGTVSVFKNTSTSLGAVSLATAVDFYVTTSSYSLGLDNLNLITSADFDLDGRIDLAVYDQTNATLFLMPNTTPVKGTLDVNTFNYNSSLGETAIELLTSLPTMTALTAAPLGLTTSPGHDRKAELLMTSSAGSLYAYVNNSGIGSPAFGAAATFSLNGTDPTSISVGDIDGDNLMDVVTANYTTNNISILRNTSTANTAVTFATASNISVTFPSAVAIASLDGDAKPDLIVTSQSNFMSGLRSTSSSGTISFESAVNFDVSPNSSSILASDLDGDSYPDIVANSYVAAGTNSKMVFYRNNAAANIPQITSFTPRALRPSVSLTITGLNFNATAANNVVNFGSNRNSAVVSATTTSATLALPKYALMAPLTLTDVVSGLSARSPMSVIPTFGSGYGSVLSNASFDAKVTFSPGSSTYPADVKLVDLDGDGKSDMVSANQNGSISIFRNTVTASGTFSFATAANTVINATNAMLKILPLDIDGDGVLDLAAISDGGTVTLFRNASTSGTITMESPITFTVSNSTNSSNNLVSIASGDFNADGKPDLALVDGSFAKIWVLLNTASKGQVASEAFGAGTEINIASGTPLSIEARDLNLDGYDDIVVSNTNGFFTLFTNTSTTTGMSFSAGTDITTGGNNTEAIALGDMDYDGKMDVVCINRANKTASVHINTTTGSTITFATKQDLSLGSVDPKALALASVDGDGKLDLVILNGATVTLPPTNDNVVVYRNTTPSAGATLTWDPSVSFPINTNGLSLAVGDLDDDEKSDIAATNYYANNNTNYITLLRNVLNSTLPINFTRIAAARKASAIQVDWLVSTEDGVSSYVVERSIDGVNFTSIGTQVPAGKAQYGWLDASPAASQNFYRIRAVDMDGNKKYSAVVRVSLQSGVPSITVAPNPVRNRNIGIQFTDMPRGSYKVDLYNAQGQLLISRAQAHDGANAVFNLVLPAAVKNGAFTLRVSDGVNSKVQQVVVE